MTTIYMIRSGECEDLQDASSGFSDVGKNEVREIETFFRGKEVDAVYVSSLKNAADTMRFFALREEVPMYVTEEFDERKVGVRVVNLDSFGKRQWDDVKYKLPGGETVVEAQDRIIDGLEKVVTSGKDKVNVIGTHGMAIALAIQFFDPTFSYEEYLRTKTIHPWIVKMEFEDKTLISLEEIRCV